MLNTNNNCMTLNATNKSYAVVRDSFETSSVKITNGASARILLKVLSTVCSNVDLHEARNNLPDALIKMKGAGK